MSQRELPHNQPGAGLQCFCTQWHRTSDGGPVLCSLTHQLHPKETLLRNKKKGNNAQEGAEVLEQVVSFFFLTPWEVTRNMMVFYKTKQKNPKPLVTTEIKQKPAAACEEGSEERASNHCRQRKGNLRETRSQDLWKTTPKCKDCEKKCCNLVPCY